MKKDAQVLIVKVSHATQCEFVQMTPVPDAWRGKEALLTLRPDEPDWDDFMEISG